jgi:hypothetical protein
MKSKLFTLLSFFYCSLLFSQTLYDINTIQDIRIVFAQSNWDALLDAEKAGSGDYISATSVTINGTVFNNVGVKYKGNSSYNSNQVKNPFHIELDTYVDQEYEGYTDLKLANVYFDPTFVRETVSYDIANKYMDAPQANYANVYVNGVLIGLYTNVESISKKFVNKHFGSNDNAFFSCSPPAGAGPQSNDFPSLQYLGNNFTSYEDAYEIKSDVTGSGWDDLIDLTLILNTDINNIESVLDVDAALWMLAFDNVMVNLDSYLGQFKQNYYLYKDDNGRFRPVVWDLNMSFGTFAMTGNGPPLRNNNEKSQLSHLLHQNDAAWPLMSKLMAVSRYKKMYLAHYKTILSENISNSDYLTTANAYQSIIDLAVQADNNKFYSNAQFTTNINSDVNAGMNTASGLTNLMNARNTYLMSQSDFTAVQPSISNVAPSVTTPLLGSTIAITTQVTNTNSTAVYLGYREGNFVPFTKVLMYDDGAHNDGAAGDNIYGVDLPITNSLTQYYIYAENNTIGAFSPARAEYEYYEITATYATLTPGDLVINEIMASNSTTATDDDGEYEDWIELYNNSSSTLSLDNLYLSDDASDPLMWQFPDGLTIAPNSYLMVWCDKDLTQTGLHADLKFSSNGEDAVLSYDDGTVIESITFGAQVTDMGYARIPNGTGNFVIQSPSFNANNETLSNQDFILNSNFVLYPNPVNDVLNINTDNGVVEDVVIHNLQGQQLLNDSFDHLSAVQIDISNFVQGVYLVTVNNQKTIKVIKQ